MESKPKKRQVRKVRSVTPAQPKSDAPPKLSPEYLIEHNGKLVEDLYVSEIWIDIILPLIQERIAGVSGRLTNGRYYHGAFTKDWSANNSIFSAGYQRAIMDLHNDLHDFVLAKNQLHEKKKVSAQDKKAPLYNPFLESLDED